VENCREEQGKQTYLEAEMDSLRRQSQRTDHADGFRWAEAGGCSTSGRHTSTEAHFGLDAKALAVWRKHEARYAQSGTVKCAALFINRAGASRLMHLECSGLRSRILNPKLLVDTRLPAIRRGFASLEE